MAYHGYLNLITQYCNTIYKKTKVTPKILEIGVDTGITAFSIYNNLNILGCPVNYTGVDILLQNHVKEFFKPYMTLKHERTKINLLEENSLKYLSDISKKNEKFDIILIDGDHNYKTVSQECEFLKSIYHANTLFIFDDYSGRYAEKDMFYANKPEYQEKKQEMFTESEDKQGIKEPIDRFVEQESLETFVIFKAEPLCVVTKDNNLINLSGGST